MGYHGPCKKLQAPISRTGSPETTSSRPWPQWPAKSILAPPLHQVYWKIASEIISGVPKKGHFKTESQRPWLVVVGWGSRGEKHHGQQADHPTLNSADKSAVFTPLNWSQPVNPDSIRFVWKSFGWLDHHPSSPNRPDLGLKIGERYIIWIMIYSQHFEAMFLACKAITFCSSFTLHWKIWGRFCNGKVVIFSPQTTRAHWVRDGLRQRKRVMQWLAVMHLTSTWIDHFTLIIRRCLAVGLLSFPRSQHSKQKLYGSWWSHSTILPQCIQKDLEGCEKNNNKHTAF